MRRFIKDISKYWNYVLYAARSDLKSEVAGSYLNWLWWILNPLLLMVVYMFITLIVFDKAIAYAPIFVFIGLTVWNFFDKVITKSATIIKSNGAIIKKVYIPKYMLILQDLMGNAFKMAISFGLVLIMMIAWPGLKFHWSCLWFFPVVLVLMLLTFGFSLLIAHVGVYIEDLKNVLTVAFRVLFYMSGVFYDMQMIDKIPDWCVTVLLQWNPSAFFMYELRMCLLHGRVEHPLTLLVWLVIALLLCTLGIRTIYKNENSYVKVI